MASKRTERQTLIIDADDTLWQNNIYFEQAIEGFVDYLNHSALSRSEVRAVLDEIELANALVHGYGSHGFARNLLQCYQHLVERHLDPVEIARIMQFGQEILEQEIVLLEGVGETLEILTMRHDLVIFTKGQSEEQKMKIDRSGIERHFMRTAIVPEKDRNAYETLVVDLGVAPALTWMIGNSPKSDINPALAAGLNAVFIPHDYTWRLEQQEIAAGSGAFLQLRQFRDLLEHF